MLGEARVAVVTSIVAVVANTLQLFWLCGPLVPKMSKKCVNVHILLRYIPQMNRHMI